jgi:hypothetical protein
VKLAAGLLLMSIVVWWQVRMVLRSPYPPFWTYVRVGQRVRGRGRSGWTVGRDRDLFGVPGADHLDALRAGHASKVDSTV